MDFWASLEHKMKYKGKGQITKKQSKDLVAYAKIINKLDGKIMLMREQNINNRDYNNVYKNEKLFNCLFEKRSKNEGLSQKL